MSEPYTVVTRVAIDKVDEARQKLKAHGFVSHFVTVDEDGKQVLGEARYGRTGLTSYEVYFHEDGRCMVVQSAFSKSRGKLLDFWLAEVTLNEGIAPPQEATGTAA